MSWYQENKFAATLMGVTIVVSGALVFLGKGAGSDADLARQREKAAVSKINAMQAAKPYPSKENEEMLEEGLVMYAEDASKFQEALLKFRPEEMEKLSPNRFSSEVSKHHNMLKAYYRSKKVEVPDKGNVFFGMEEYATKMAPESATSYLDYQRKGLQWLFMKLADSGIDSLKNVYRAPVAESLGNPSPIKPAPRRGSRANKNNVPQVITSVHEGLPIEITFTATEESLQKFLTEITASEEYFFAVKLLKIRNEEQDQVVISKATFAPPVVKPEVPEEGEAPSPAPAEGGGFDLGAGFDIGGEEFAVEEDKEIIKQVIGDEKITVFMQLELVLYKEGSSIVIPRLKKEEPSKETPRKVTTK